MFKRWGLVLACGWCLLLLQTSAVSASLRVGDVVRFYDREGNSGGGEFGLAMAGTVGDLNKPELFRTFCLERTEYLDFNAAGFKIVGITDNAVNGGPGAGPSGDPLDRKTKVLYWWFSEKMVGQHMLNGYNYAVADTKHVASANELQEAFWSLESEGVNADGKAAEWITNAQNWIAGATNDDLAFVDSHVKVLNLVWATSRSRAVGSVAQDQLYYSHVPEPLSLTVWAGVGGVFCLFSRRRRQASV